MKEEMRFGIPESCNFSSIINEVKLHISRKLFRSIKDIRR